MVSNFITILIIVCLNITFVSSIHDEYSNLIIDDYFVQRIVRICSSVQPNLCLGIDEYKINENGAWYIRLKSFNKALIFTEDFKGLFTPIQNKTLGLAYNTNGNLLLSRDENSFQPLTNNYLKLPTLSTIPNTNQCVSIMNCTNGICGKDDDTVSTTNTTIGAFLKIKPCKTFVYTYNLSNDYYYNLPIQGQQIKVFPIKQTNKPTDLPTTTNAIQQPTGQPTRHPTKTTSYLPTPSPSHSPLGNDIHNKPSLSPTTSPDCGRTYNNNPTASITNVPVYFPTTTKTPTKYPTTTTTYFYDINQTQLLFNLILSQEQIISELSQLIQTNTELYDLTLKLNSIIDSTIEINDTLSTIGQLITRSEIKSLDFAVTSTFSITIIILIVVVIWFVMNLYLLFQLKFLHKSDSELKKEIGITHTINTQNLENVKIQVQQLKEQLDLLPAMFDESVGRLTTPLLQSPTKQLSVV